MVIEAAPLSDIPTYTMQVRCGRVERMVCESSLDGRVRLDSIANGVVRFDPREDGRVDVFVSDREGGQAVARQSGWSKGQIRQLAAELVLMCDRMDAGQAG